MFYKAIMWQSLKTHPISLIIVFECSLKQGFVFYCVAFPMVLKLGSCVMSF